jgi:hypothetical protein
MTVLTVPAQACGTANPPTYHRPNRKKYFEIDANIFDNPAKYPRFGVELVTPPLPPDPCLECNPAGGRQPAGRVSATQPDPTQESDENASFTCQAQWHRRCFRTG